MADKPWKQFERDMGKLIGGTRFWANSGESVDCEGPVFLAQCKNVKNMSLNAMAELAYQVAEEGRKHKQVLPNKKYHITCEEIGSSVTWGSETMFEEIPNPKLGILCMKTRPGRGKKARTIVVMDESVFKELFPTGGRCEVGT